MIIWAIFTWAEHHFPLLVGFVDIVFCRLSEKCELVADIFFLEERILLLLLNGENGRRCSENNLDAFVCFSKDFWLLVADDNDCAELSSKGGWIGDKLGGKNDDENGIPGKFLKSSVPRKFCSLLDRFFLSLVICLERAIEKEIGWEGMGGIIIPLDVDVDCWCVGCGLNGFCKNLESSSDLKKSAGLIKWFVWSIFELNDIWELGRFDIGNWFNDAIVGIIDNDDDKGFVVVELDALPNDARSAKGINLL